MLRISSWSKSATTAAYLVTPSAVLVSRHGNKNWLFKVPDLDVVAVHEVVSVRDELTVLLFEGAYTKCCTRVLTDCYETILSGRVTFTRHR